MTRSMTRKSQLNLYQDENSPNIRWLFCWHIPLFIWSHNTQNIVVTFTSPFTFLSCIFNDHKWGRPHTVQNLNHLYKLLWGVLLKKTWPKLSIYSHFLYPYLSLRNLVFLFYKDGQCLSSISKTLLPDGGDLTILLIWIL